MSNFLINLLMAVIVAIAGVVARELLPFLREKRKEAVSSLRRTQWEWVADIVDAVVRAVEQTVSGELHGEDKKKYAVNQIVQLLDRNGLKVDYAQIEALVEATVQAINAETVKLEPIECLGGCEVEDEL